jgi:hypothetical protein
MRRTRYVCGIFEKITETLDGRPLCDVRAVLGQALNIPPDAVPVVNGRAVTEDSPVPAGATIAFVPSSPARKGSGHGLDPVLELLRGLDLRLAGLERKVQDIHRAVSQPKPDKEWYGTAEFGKVVDRDEYTVREWCRLGRLNAEKTCSGRGNRPEWRISHAELGRYRREGLLPFRRPG